MTLDGKRILLTGASSGVGREAALLLARRGARLALSARREDRLTALAEEIGRDGGHEARVLTADLSLRGEAVRLADAALEVLGGIDVVINNAGTTMQALTWIGADRDEAREMFETNVWSQAALVARIAPRMIEQGSGTIVNVGSMARVAPYPHLGHYAASRAAGMAMTQMMGVELRPHGVRVVGLDFGAIDSAASFEVRGIRGIERWLEGPPGLGTIEDAAAAIVRAAGAEAPGLAFYPAALRWIDRFPVLGRRYLRRLARGADLHDTTLRYAGTQGDRALQREREEWDAAHPDG
ncbi:MAG: SDR family NAD(P)-dependent oxidoreductase [Nocardioides sp.]|uniref:SDR family NAD(P)-dependent oxidoreductase n=1 Tax=Nocardioides sp. TaxID=35761 RepID=UPI0039E304E0